MTSRGSAAISDESRPIRTGIVSGASSHAGLNGGGEGRRAYALLLGAMAIWGVNLSVVKALTGSPPTALRRVTS